MKLFRIIPISLTVLLFAFPSCKNKKVDDLENPIVADSLNKIIQSMELNKDSLKTTIQALETEIKLLLSDTKNKTPAESEIIRIVYSMHQSWENLPKTKDPDQILTYFLPQFTAQEVSIDTENNAQVVRFTHEDFKSFLKKISKRKGMSYEFGKTNILDIEIKDNTYFNLVYKCHLNVNSKNKLAYTNSILVTITGKRTKGEWKIGNYSWVEFKYE